MMNTINNLVLDTTSIILIVVFAIAAILLIICGVFAFLKYKKEAKKVKETENKLLKEKSDDEFIKALGGKENIVNYELKGVSRLSLTLKDNSLLDKETLKKFYIVRFLEMSDRMILVGENLKPLVEILDKSNIN